MRDIQKLSKHAMFYLTPSADNCNEIIITVRFCDSKMIEYGCSQIIRIQPEADTEDGELLCTLERMKDWIKVKTKEDTEEVELLCALKRM